MNAIALEVFFMELSIAALQLLVQPELQDGEGEQLDLQLSIQLLLFLSMETSEVYVLLSMEIL